MLSNKIPIANKNLGRLEIAFVIVTTKTQGKKGNVKRNKAKNIKLKVMVAVSCTYYNIINNTIGTIIIFNHNELHIHHCQT